jgi:hypothetical protein
MKVLKIVVNEYPSCCWNCQFFDYETYTCFAYLNGDEILAPDLRTDVSIVTEQPPIDCPLSVIERDN